MSDHENPQSDPIGNSNEEMSPGQFSVVKAAFLHCSSLGLVERDEYLLTEFQDQPEIREMVLRLLKAAERPLPYETLADDLLVAHIKAQDSADQAGEAQGGSRIGGYRLLERLGEGGFGVVYRAQQESPVTREVALKVIKLGMDTEHVIARFEAERQALALMEHPCIAKVFDAGSTQTGRPYFVMELVRGEPITSYCDRVRMPISDRLNLFKRVCDALHHAHQKGIIHRDIKPTNVLVSESDGEVTPKIIDFGIAKATNARLSEKTIFTEFRQMIGTPEYMSPEQAERSVSQLDSRSDVYSLGVVLYQLLTGTTPFDSERLRSAAYVEMQRIIRDEEPQRPSTRLSQSETVETIAGNRSITPDKLDSTLSGELDWMVMRCLEKNPSRRYDSAAELGREIQRYLSGNPVVAVPPSKAYLLQKWFTRHRKPAIVAAALLLIMVIGLVGTSVGYLNAQNQQRIAESEADRADWQTYVAQMQLAWSAIGDKPGRANNFLENAPEQHRGWEWHAMNSRLDLSYLNVHTAWPANSNPYTTGKFPSTIAHPDGQSVFHIFSTGELIVLQRDLETGNTLLTIPRQSSPDNTRITDRAHISHDGNHLYIIYGEARTTRSESNTTPRSFSLHVWDVQRQELVQQTAFDMPWNTNDFVYQESTNRIFYSIGSTVYSKLLNASTSDRFSNQLPFNVTSASLDPHNNQIFLKGGRGQASVLNTETLEVVAHLEGHTNLIRGIDFSKDGHSIITSSLDGSARIWDLRSDPPQQVVIEVGIPTNHAWLSDDGAFAVTEAGILQVWDVQTGEPIATLDSGSTVAWTSFLMHDQNIAGSLNSDGSLRLWYLDSWSTVHLEGHTGHVNAARFTGPTGYVVSAGWDGWASNDSGCIRIWDAETGLHIASLGEAGDVAMSVEISSDGKYAVSRITRGQNIGLAVIDLVDGTIRHIPGLHEAAVIHPTEPLLISALDDRFIMRNIQTGEVLQSWTKPYTIEGQLIWLPRQSSLGSLVCPVLIDNEPTICVIDIESSMISFKVQGMYAVASTDFQTLYTYLPSENQLLVYDANSMKLLRSGSLDGLGSGRLTLDANNQRIASSSPDDQAVMLWDIETLNRVAVFSNDGYVSDLSWSPDGTRFLTTWDNSIQILDSYPVGKRAQMRSALEEELGINTQRATDSDDVQQSNAVEQRAKQIRDLLNGLRVSQFMTMDGS